jgi:hypothetical protein
MLKLPGKDLFSQRWIYGKAAYSNFIPALRVVIFAVEDSLFNEVIRKRKKMQEIIPAYQFFHVNFIEYTLSLVFEWIVQQVFLSMPVHRHRKRMSS